MTNVRYLVLAATMCVAVNMYLDRACLALVIDVVRVDLALEPWQEDWVLGAFFWAYALGQVPAGVLGIRIGYRRALTLYLVTWSVFTAAVGFVGGFAGLLAARLAVGLAEAGAYPTAAAIVRGWFPVGVRGRANSVVAFGGRAGWAAAQILTPILVATFAGLGVIGWRAALAFYGAAGILAAVGFWVVVRDRPRVHPWANAAEADYAGPPEPPPVAKNLPMRAIVSSRNVWLLCVVMFGTNLGWAFLLTKLPTFLTTARGVTDLAERGRMAAVPAWASCAGLLAGGVITDFLSRRLGVRRGRALPIAVMLGVGAVAYPIAGQMADPWAVVAVLAVMAVGVDIGNPGLWAFAQDVGGPYAGAVLGWANMWGNIGAGLSPVILGFVQRAYGWDAVFATGGIAFAVAAAAAAFLNAARPVRPEPA